MTGSAFGQVDRDMAWQLSGYMAALREQIACSVTRFPPCLCCPKQKALTVQPRACSLEPAMSLYLVTTVEMSWLQMNVVSGPRPRRKGGSRGLSAACSPGKSSYVLRVTVAE